jgi:hypothetical protein
MKKLTLSLYGLFSAILLMANGGGVVIKADPGTSNGYLCWEPVANSTYQVLILERSVDTNMTVSYDTLTTLTPTQNYLRIDSQYTNSPLYYYKVNILNSLNQIVDDSDFEKICPGCPEEGSYLEMCGWTCNGPDYAYTLNLLTNEAYSNGYLTVNSAINYYDYDAGIAVLLYEPMSPFAFSAKGYSLEGENDGRITYRRTDVSEGEDIRDISDDLLSGTVYFCEKKLNQFSLLPPIYSEILSISVSECGNALDPWAINTYNTYPETTLPIELECAVAFGEYPDDNEDENNGDQPNEDWWVEIDELWEDFEPTIDNLLNGLPGLAASGQTWVRVDEVSVDFSFIQVSKIDGGVFTTVNLDPNSIFDHGGNFVAPTASFPTGLYRVTFGWENGSVLPLVFEHDQTSFVPVTNANFANLTVSPNPIQNNNLAININVERKMSFTLQILTLSGATLHTEQISMDADATLQKNISVSGSNFPYNQMVIKLIFADGSSIQETAIRP